MERTMTIRYIPRKSDYIRASRALALKTRTFLVFAGVIGLILVGSAVVLASPAIGNGLWRNIGLIGLTVSVFYALYFFIVIPYQLSKAFKTKEHMRMAREITFTGEEVRMTIDDRTIALGWESIQKAIDGGDFYLLINKGEERIYPFVPARAFDNERMQAAFLDLLKTKSIPMI